MVNKYCSKCGIKVAKLASGSSMKKGAVILCRACYDRLLLADRLIQQRVKTSDNPVPDFLSGFFK